MPAPSAQGLEKIATVIVPIRNGATTLPELLKSFESQEHEHLVDRILLIVEQSNDATMPILRAFQKESKYRVEVDEFDQPLGFAKKINIGIRKCATPYFILCHQDIILHERDSILGVLNPLFSDPGAVASYSSCVIPDRIWDNYPFFQKCAFPMARNNKVAWLNGSFDAFNAKLFAEHCGQYSENYQTAGEDWDIVIRIKKKGQRIVEAPVTTTHIHENAGTYPFAAFLRKSNQTSESFGAIIGNHGIGWAVKADKLFLLSLGKYSLVPMLLVPYARLLALAGIAFYSVYWGKDIFRYDRSPARWVLPVLNVAVFLLGFFYVVKGALLRRQTVETRV